VRVHAGGNGRSEGAILSGSPALVRLRTGSNIKIVSVGRIDSLWVQTGSCGGPGAKKGAFIGGTILGLGLGVVGAVAAETGQCASRYADPCHSREGAFVAGVLFGGAVGAGLGALIGSASPKWEL
jgi:hypothetical protein